MFVPGKHFQPSVVFVGEARSLPSKWANIRQGWKWMIMKNSLAYCDMELIAAVNTFNEQGLLVLNKQIEVLFLIKIIQILSERYSLTCTLRIILKNTCNCWKSFYFEYLIKIFNGTDRYLALEKERGRKKEKRGKVKREGR